MVYLLRFPDHNDAIADSKGAVNIYRELAEIDTVAFRLEFARSLDFLSLALRNAGKRDKALVASQESKKIF